MTWEPIANKTGWYHCTVCGLRMPLSERELAGPVHHSCNTPPRAYWDGERPPQKATTARSALDLDCALRGEPTRMLEGCGCGVAPGVYACGHPDNKQGECIAMLGSGRKRKAVEQSGLWVCETCQYKHEALVHIEPPRYPASR